LTFYPFFCVADEPSSAAYGTVFNGYPFWEERAALVWLNMVRQAPSVFKQVFLPPTSTGSFLNQPPVKPLLWQYDLTRSARAHSKEKVEVCPNSGTSPHNSCDGTDPFTRIATFYPPGGSAENYNAPPSSAYQYFHVPKHNTRAYVCDGPFEWTIDSGQGNNAWPTFSCPADGPSAGHRKAIMDPTLKFVGIGVWGMGGNLINAAPQIQTQDFATDESPSPPYYPNVRIFSASHVFIGTGQTDNMQTLQFWANYFGSGVTSAIVWVDGTNMPLTCKAGWGPSADNCVYTSDVLPTGAGCRLYFFTFIDSVGTTRYPDTGAFFTYGEGNCLQNWITQADADPLIAKAGAGGPVQTTQATQPGQTTTTTATPPPVTATFPPPPVTAAGATSPPPGTNGGTGAQPPTLLYAGATGTRLRVRYLATFTDYIRNNQFVQPLMDNLRNSTSGLLGVSTNVFAAEKVTEGSVVVEWFLVDGAGAPGSAAAIVDSFLARLKTGSDIPIGNHQPPIADAVLVTRAGFLGSPGGAALDLAIIIGAAVGGVVFLVLVGVLVYLLVRYLRDRTPSNYKASSSSSSAARYEPLPSVNHAGYAARTATPNHKQEPLMGAEPLLYLARNSREAIERQTVHRRTTPKTVGRHAAAGSPAPGVQRALILQDFDGASVAPNCLAVRKGETVTVEDSSSPEWWDVRNANHELGFVPASYCRLLAADRPPLPVPPAHQQQQQQHSYPQQQQNHNAMVLAPATAVSQAAYKPVPIPPSKKKPTPVAKRPAAVAAVAAAPIPLISRKTEYATVVADFDATQVPNGLSVCQGERVEVLERSNADWWDVRNATQAVGFVPASFLRVGHGPVPLPPAAAAKKTMPVVVEDFDNDVTVQEMQVEELMGGDDDLTTEVPLIELNAFAEPSQPSGAGAISPKSFPAPRKAAPAPPAKLAAPIPGVRFRAEFDYTAAGETETSLKAGDPLIAPVGAELDGEWVFVLNRRTHLKGFVPKAWTVQE
jgi:hypothetical protein